MEVQIMSLINMSSVNFDSKMFLNQIQNNTIDNTNKNLNESDKVVDCNLIIMWEHEIAVGIMRKIG